ncbi:MAG: CDP-alcohol phosphatidyltransferase family protein [Faecousia sp.]
MIIKDWKKDVFTIPNILSLVRLLLIPVYVIIYLNATKEADYYLAAGILAVSCLTDMIDGKIARHFNMKSTIGMLLDPVADKATQFTLIVCLAVSYPILWNLVVLFVIKEGFQLLVGAITYFKDGKMLHGALLPGKICTTILFLSLIILVMIPSPSKNLVTVFTAVDAAFLVFAFVAYILAYFGKNKKVYDIEQ